MTSPDITISDRRLRWAVDGMRFTAPLLLWKIKWIPASSQGNIKPCDPNRRTKEKDPMDSKVDQTQSSPKFKPNRSLSSVQMFHTHNIKFVSFHLPQMKFNSTCFSYQCRVWNQVCAIEIHMDISQRNFCSTLPPKKKNSHQRACWLAQIQSLVRIPMKIQNIRL